MRLSRKRRREGLRCIVVELRITEIDTLIAKGLLEAGAREDRQAVRKALYSFLDETLGNEQ
jgi:hypothetical protein